VHNSEICAQPAFVIGPSHSCHGAQPPCAGSMERDLLLFRLVVAIMILTDMLPILRCPSCGGVMKHARIVPRPGGVPHLHVALCLRCDEVKVIEETRAA
jgi:hypothetical protein